ncbi:MAG: ester cyclase [Desulfovibrio sp.]|nr:ester cyclase [Desulfovibrio sp.]
MFSKRIPILLISVVFCLLTCACHASRTNTAIADMSAATQEQRNKAAMKRFETMINTCDDALAAELVDAKAPFYTPASKEPVYGGQGYLGIVRFMRKGFSDVQWKLEEMAADGNIVAVRWTCTGTHDGPFMGSKPTGKHFAATVMNFYYFNGEGKIINDVAAEGMIAILRQIGLVKL